MVNWLSWLRRKAAPADIARPYRVLFTRGGELMTPPAYRGAFETALARSLTNTSDVPDEYVMRAFAVSVTAHICTEYRASKTAGIPLKVVNGAGLDLQDTPISFFLTRASNLLQDWARSHLIFGRTYLRKRYNARGYPTGLKWLNPLDVYEYSERNRVTGYRITLEDGTTENVGLREVIYTQAFDARPGGNGLSKFEAAWLALTGEQSLATHSAAFFVNSARPDGFLTFDEPLNEEEYTEARKEWRANFQGVKNGHKTAVMPGGARWNPMTAVPADLAMTELKGVYREDVCGIFEVDPILVGLKGTADPLSANSTYGTAETAHIRGVTLPFVNTVVLPALNEQWALTDFDQRDRYHLVVDTMAIPALVESQLTKADTSAKLSDAHVLDYAESRALLGYEARDGYFIRKPDEALSLWNASGLTLNALHQMTLGTMPLGANGDVLLVGGQYIPAARIMELAHANVEKLKAPPAPAFGLSAPVSAPVQVAPVPTPALLAGEPAERADDHSLCAMLYFAPSDPTLLSLQRRLQEIYAGQDVQWTPAAEFHVTVFYAPEVTDVQAGQFGMALSALATPDDLNLSVGSLHSFDNVGEHALHFRIRRSQALLDYQERVFDAAQGIGILASPHSAPESYLPHITMGYASERARALTYSGKADVRPATLRLMFGDTCVHETALTVPSVARSAEDYPPLQLAVDLSGNQFVRYARRLLSEALGSVNVDWVDETDWRLTLAQAEEWTPNALATLIRSADYTQANKVDARLNQFTELDGVLYVNVQGQTAALENAARLDLEAGGLRANVLEATAAEGIRLGALLAKLPEDFSFPPVDFPIVLTKVNAYVGNAPYHSWMLRSASVAQLRELQNWQHVVERKGASYAFRAETLPQAVRDFLQVALADGDGAQAFVEARALLSDTRAYTDTRAGFKAEVEALISAANADENSRREFASQLRSVLRRYGLMAFRDGMERGGYSPESFSADELAAFRAWQAESSEYVTGIGEALFKLGDTPDPAFRSELWCAKSLDDIYFIGLRFGAAEMPATWKLGGTVDHCDSCKARDGETRTVAEWAKVGFPRDNRLDCGGWACECGLFDADGRRMGVGG